MEMMLGVLMTLASVSFGASLTPPNISVDCEDEVSIPPGISLLDHAPGSLAALKISLSVENGLNMLNISWAISNDVTAKYIEATEIKTGQETLKCEYTPSIPEAISRGLIPKNQEQVWFSYKIHMLAADYYHVQAANLPLPPYEHGPIHKTAVFYVEADEDYTPEGELPTIRSCVDGLAFTAPDRDGLFPLLGPVCGGVILALILLTFGYVTCNYCIHKHNTTSFISSSINVLLFLSAASFTALTDF